MRHLGSDPANPGWARAYTYNEPSLLEPGKQSNRLTSTTIDGTTETYSTAGDGYDAHGNMTAMPHLQPMQWDFKDQLQMTQRQAVNGADADGVQHQGSAPGTSMTPPASGYARSTELANGALDKDERIYLGGFEIYRKKRGEPARARDAARHGRQAAHRPGRDAHPGQRPARRRSSSATSSATTSARPSWSWTTRRRSSPTRNTPPTAARRTRRCAVRPRRPSGTATRARSGTRRAGSTITGRGIMRRGWESGLLVTLWVQLTARICMSSSEATQYAFMTH